MENNMSEGHYFDPIFTEARERWRKERRGTWTIPQEQKEALENSIVHDYTTEPLPIIPEKYETIVTIKNNNSGEMECTNFEP